MNPIAAVKNIPTMISQTGGRSVLLVKKFSPEILLVGGIAGGITAAVMACKATRKVDDILDEHENAMAQINMGESCVDDDDGEKLVKKLKFQTNAKLLKNISKLYAPPVVLGAASIGCILGSHGILSKRNMAIAAAYSVVQDRFNEYRDRVRDKLGENDEKNLYFGTEQKTVEDIVIDEKTGKEKKVKKKVNVLKDPNDLSQYARFFDDGSPNWVQDAELNLAFLRAQQNYCNDLLKARGHLFLNEVYDIIGIPRSKAGAIVGWVISKDSDNYVDFGLYSIRNQEAADFVNGYEESILLDFNVDGVIYDLI